MSGGYEPKGGVTAAGGRSCCLSSRRCPESLPFGFDQIRDRFCLLRIGKETLGTLGPRMPHSSSSKTNRLGLLRLYRAAGLKRDFQSRRFSASKASKN